MFTKAELKHISSLKVKKYRDLTGEYLAEGFSVCEEAIRSTANVKLLLVKGSVSGEQRTKDLLAMAGKDSIPYEVIKDGEFDKLSALDTPPGVMCMIGKSSNPALEADMPYLILDAIKDPGNLGTIIRTADWFGFNNIMIGRDSVDVYSPKVVQATMGSIFHVNIVDDQDLFTQIKTLQAQNYTIIATSLTGKTHDLKNLTKKIAVLVGNETTGLNPELLTFADILYKIGGSGRAESLNVSVATGVVLHELFNLNK